MRHYIFYIDQEFIRDHSPDYYARKLSSILEAPVELEVVSTTQPLSAQRVQASMRNVAEDERACLVFDIHGSAIDDQHHLWSPGHGYRSVGRSPSGERLVQQNGDNIPLLHLIGEVADAHNRPLDIGVSSCNMTRSDVDAVLGVMPEGGAFWSQGATDKPLVTYSDNINNVVVTLEEMKKNAARQARKLDDLPVQAIFYALARHSLTHATSTNFPIFAVAGGEQYDLRKQCTEFVTSADSENVLRNTGLPERITQRFQDSLALNIESYLVNLLMQTQVAYDSRTMHSMRKNAADHPTSFGIKAVDVSVDYYRKIFSNDDFIEIDSRFLERLSQDLARRAICSQSPLTLREVCNQAIEGLSEYPELPETSRQTLRTLPASERCFGFHISSRVPDYLHHGADGANEDSQALQSAQVYCSGETLNLFSHVFQSVKQYLQGNEPVASGFEKYWLDVAREFVERDPGFMAVGNAQSSAEVRVIGTFLPDIAQVRQR